MKLVTQRTFAASHRLPEHRGKCKGLHGHNWKVRVQIEGTLIVEKDNPQNGMLVDFGKVKELIDAFDHRDLNEMFSEECPPTAENIAAVLGKNLLGLQDNISRVTVQIWESDVSYIQWDSDEDISKSSINVALYNTGSNNVAFDVKLNEANKDILNAGEDEDESQ